LKQGAALLSRGPYFWKENPKHTFWREGACWNWSYLFFKIKNKIQISPISHIRNPSPVDVNSAST
jgi:hypothetical protein